MNNVSKKINSSQKPMNSLGETTNEDSSKIRICVMLSAVLCMISTVAFDKSKDLGGYAFPMFGLMAVCGVVVYLYINKKLNSRNAVYIILLAGFLIRLNYVLYTPLSETVRVRQHDVYKFGGEVGHSAYIEHFYNNGYKLPDFDPVTKAQFYQPPLNHFIEALWMRILTTFGMSYTRAIGSLMFLPLFYSTCCMLVSERIFSKVNLNNSGKVIALSIIAFHPTFIILSGSINNDILSILFMLLSVYAAIVWYKESTMKNILFIALYLGLGMMTKVSAALTAFPIALLFAEKLFYEKKKIYSKIGQYAAFAGVCLPLGLWFPVRNAIKYKMPLVYVPRLSDTSDQYIGFRSVGERLFGMADHPFRNPFLNKIANGDEYFEYNPFVSLIKTSLFGEYNYSDSGDFVVSLCKILLFVNIIMILLSIVGMIYCTVRKSAYLDRVEKIFFVFFDIVLLGYFIKFVFDFPHTCSMDIRYVTPSIVLGAMFIGMGYEQIKSDYRENETLLKVMKYSVSGLTAAFGLFSTLVYILIGG